MKEEDFRREFQGDPLPNPSIESMADIIHWLWSHWMKYMFSVLKNHQGDPHAMGMTDPPIFLRFLNEPKMIPDYEYTRWKRQMMLSYFDLPEDEKKSDRDLAKQIFGSHFVYDPFTGEEL